MRMYVAGQWVSKPQSIPVENPYDRSVVDTVPRADRGDVERALESAVRGARVMAKLSGYDRSRILRKAADLMVARQEDLGRTISLEEGKAIAEGRLEASRAVETILGSAEEAKRIHGETIPVDGAPGGGGKIAFTLRVPCGVVVAITPFNFPLNLVCHKVGPALAAGNAVIVKPATDTPLSALKLTEILLEAGLPAEGIQCLTGPGGELGDLLCADPRVRKITFTGSRDVGERICRVAGIKRVTMELGSNAPVIVMPDADLDKVAEAVAMTGYANAGQVCISAQRILASGRIYSDFLDALKPRVEAITTGSQLEDKVKMGPMVREKEAVRVDEWVREAVSAGARLVTGGERRGADLHPDDRGGRQARDADLRRGAVRPGGRGDAVRRHRPGDRARQRLALRSLGGHLHGEPRVRHEVRAGGPVREPAHQLGTPVAGGPHAVRRAQGVRIREGGSTIRRRGDDRAQGGGAAPARIDGRLSGARGARAAPARAPGGPA